MVPVVRAAFPYAAGVAKMPFGRFFTLATLGSILWIVGLGAARAAVGSSWQSWRHHLEYVDYVGAAIVVAVDRVPVLRRDARAGRGARRRMSPS